jgi:CBS domain-containing protein
MLLREFLHKAPVTVPPECTVQEAAGLMASHGVGCVVVVSGGEIRGILTDRDISVRVMATGRPATTPVGEVMTVDPVTVEGGGDIVDAYRALKDREFRRLPVLEEGELAGIVTVDDLLVGLVLELASVISPVAREVVKPELSG